MAKEDVPTGKANRAGELNVQQLQTFQCVFEEHGYAPAARRLELSVPTVWQQIQAMERLYGVPLFEKRGRGIVATPAAEQLHIRYSQILAGLDSTFEMFSAERTGDEPITLLTGMRMFFEDLAVPLSQFKLQFNNRLIIYHGDNRKAEEAILSDQVDLALTLEGGQEEKSPLIHYEPAYSIEFIALSTKDHSFASSSQNTLRELVKHDLIVTVPGTHGRDALEHALLRENLKANVVAETDNSGFTIACVRAGLGVGVAAGRIDGLLTKGLFVRSLERHLGRRQTVVMWKRGRPLTKPMQVLIEKIKEFHNP